MRPQNLEIDENDHVWVADACNHRIQVFDATGDKVRRLDSWGTAGSQPGNTRNRFIIRILPRWLATRRSGAYLPPMSSTGYGTQPAS